MTKTFFVSFAVLAFSIFFELSVFSQFNQHVHIEICHDANQTHNHLSEHLDHHELNVVENSAFCNLDGSSMFLPCQETGCNLQKFTPFFFQPPERV